MKAYFDSPEKQTALLNETTRWLETPFRENSAVPGPGGGVSCHFLIAEILFNTGALDRFDVPRGSVRQFLNEAPNAMLAFLDAHLGDRVLIVEPGAPVLPGDILVIAENDHTKHVGIALPGRPSFVHVLRLYGVTINELADSSYQIVAMRRVFRG